MRLGLSGGGRKYILWRDGISLEDVVALYVKDPEVDQMAERLSRIAGISKTEAVRRALRRQLEQVETPSDFVERGLAFTRALIARGDLAEGQPVDKAWIDSLYEDD